MTDIVNVKAREILDSRGNPNIEVDIIGKYVEKLLAASPIETEKSSTINSAFLAEHGFLR